MADAHTPGPIDVVEAGGGWSLRAESVGRGYFAGIGHANQRDPNPREGGGISWETAKANALLWAAAPALLHVLRETAESLVCVVAPPARGRATREDCDCWACSRAFIAFAVIAEAEGRA